jgi:hypothetical protein
MAFSTRIGDRTILTGISLGDGPTMSPVARQVLKILTEHAKKDDELFIVLCWKINTAASLVMAAVNGAKDGQAVFILCKDSKVYDAVHITRLLGLER